MRCPVKRAFTIVELLAVVSIIAFLLALLLPAVQAARETSRQMTCSNHLRQIGLGIQSYHDTYGRIPAGGFFYAAASTKNTPNVLITMLPYLEQQLLYDSLKPNSGIHLQTLGDGSPAHLVKLAVYTCPSDNNSRLFNTDPLKTYDSRYGGVRSLANYAASEGATKIAGEKSDCSCAGWTTWNSHVLRSDTSHANPSGPFSYKHYSWHWIDFGSVTDGLSNTIFFGEVRVDCSTGVSLPPAGWGDGWSENGYANTLIPINFDTCNWNATDACRRPCNWTTTRGFKSRHPGGANFLLGDASVRFLPETIDHHTYQRLGDMADGQPVSLP